MIFKEKIKKLQLIFKTAYYRKLINKKLTNPVFDSFISSILRLFFKSKFIFQIYWFLKSSVDINSFNQFWNVYIGFVIKRKYFSFIKLDRYLSNNPFCCSNLKKLPFKHESCHMIKIKHFFKYFQIKNLHQLITSWKKKLIPGGVLQIHMNVKNNGDNLEKLKQELIDNMFFIKNINDFGLKIDNTIIITAVKEKDKKITINKIPYKKIEDIFLILKQNYHIFSNKKKICFLGYQSKKFTNSIENLNLNIDDIHCFENLSSIKSCADDFFDFAVIFNFLEYNNHSTNYSIFSELRRIVKSKMNILVIIPEYNYYSTKESAQYFNKGIFVKILDELNLSFEWINLSSTFKMIQVLIKNENNFPIKKNETKILLLGVYSLRYTFLNNARWDSQARAFEKLGYNTQILDIKDNSFVYLIKYIDLYKPDILWIAGKVAYQFLKKYAQFFRMSKIKVVYWMWDITSFNSFDFNGVIDYMFITSKGQIPLYKKKFNLDKIYYMPASIMPEIIHRNKFIKEEFDVGFSGQLNYLHPWYKERTQILDLINQHFNVKVFLEIYNNLPEYYSKCKIVFGGTPYFKDLELYASNRPFIALSCGCCFITNYFKGLEKLAENEKHLLWYNNKDELIHLLKKYIYNRSLREEIRKNAERLGREKHHYIIRITNMLDIIDGKTDTFYGFIQ